MEILFKERIAEALKLSGISQKRLAEMLKISESNITNWKKGENLPSVEVLFKLCKIFDVSADYLLGLSDY